MKPTDIALYSSMKSNGEKVLLYNKKSYFAYLTTVNIKQDFNISVRSCSV